MVTPLPMIMLAQVQATAQPVPRPTPQAGTRPNVLVAAETPRQRTVREAQELLARAETVRKDYRPARGQPSRQELDTAIDKVKSDLDTMSELSEMDSLRLQAANERMAELMAMLSNVLKKISDTQQGIVQNIK
jgi:hypothetical protein